MPNTPSVVQWSDTIGPRCSKFGKIFSDSLVGSDLPLECVLFESRCPSSSGLGKSDPVLLSFEAQRHYALVVVSDAVDPHVLVPSLGLGLPFDVPWAG